VISMDVRLIDGTYELFRHFFAVPAAADVNGQETWRGARCADLISVQFRTPRRVIRVTVVIRR
jgi:hypothetical protein